ncbi:MAG: SPFH domain-containing protein [Treponemataceae bacterium]
MVWVIIAIAIIILVLIIVNIRIVPQSQAYVIERLGGYNKTWSVGLHVKFPFIDKIRKKISLKENVRDFDPQPVITKDNVTMQIDTVVYCQVTDPKLYTYGVENPMNALENLTATTLRNIIGELELDETLTSRDVINSKMRVILDEATDPWGIKVNRVEVKNIEPPQAIRDAMEKQMRAERERREQILIAEGHKQSAILEAEGKKQAMILEAEAQKQSLILQAEAQRQAVVEKAKGDAEAILQVQNAKSKGFRMLKEVQIDGATLKLRSLEAFEKASDGQATKIIIPSEIQNLAGLVTSVSELTK